MQQIRLRTILANDPVFKKWMAKNPLLPERPGPLPWRLYVQREEGGGWAYKDFPLYTDAYNALAKRLSTAHDLALHCNPQAYRPPRLKVGKETTWWPRPSYHKWCPYCRRPVLLVNKRRHPAHPTIKRGEPILMCGICGARWEFIQQTMNNDFESSLVWPIEK